jgi:hypothetical protein
MLGRVPHNVEVGFLELVFLHHARGFGERALARFVARALVLGFDLLATHHAIGRGEANLDVLSQSRFRGDGEGQSGKGQ